MAVPDTCPACGAGEVRTTDSRMQGNGRRRRKRCPACGHRWSTQEIPAALFKAGAGALAEVDRAMAALARVRTALRGEGDAGEPGE